MASAQAAASEEPFGIIISRGKRDEPAPLFWAYVWGPAPEAEHPAAEPKVA
jgi:hypothetical protein